MDALVRHGGQFQDMFPSPFRHGIGKHGPVFTEQGAGLHFHIEAVVPFLQQQVETAVSHCHFAPRQMPAFPARNLLRVRQPGSHIVVVLRVEQDGYTVPFNSDHVVRGLASRLCRFPDIQDRMGEQEFPHAARVRHMARDNGARVQPDRGDEAVRAADEGTPV